MIDEHEIPGPHWLRIELSGAHVIWWLSWLYVIGALMWELWSSRLPPARDLELAMRRALEGPPPYECLEGFGGAVAAGGFILKFFIPSVWAEASREASDYLEPDPMDRSDARQWYLRWSRQTSRERMHYYRWWARGIWPALLALAPGVGYVIWYWFDRGMVR